MKTANILPSRVVAVIVSYHPQGEFIENIKAMMDQVGAVIIVDNDSGSNLFLERAASLQRVKIIRNPTNMGVARALNQGFECAIREGYDFVLTLDQDSLVLPDMVGKLLDIYSLHPRAERIAITGPSAEDPNVGIRSRHLRSRGKWLFELVSPISGWLDNVTFIITSGSLFRTDAYREIGPFRDDLFIDYVDIEYCLRVWGKGYEVVVNCDARMEHHLGQRQKRIFLGRAEYPRFHPPLRWYYSNRNRIQLLKDYAVRFPFWAMYEILNSFYGFARMILLEDRRMEKVKAVFIGCLDGIRGKLGVSS
jgi:rhamnosyltransferase